MQGGKLILLFTGSEANGAGPIRLRLKLPSGETKEGLEVQRDATYGRLLQLCAESAGLSAETFSVRSGFPPRELNLDLAAPVCSMLNHMETLILSPRMSPAVCSEANESTAKRKRARTKNDEDSPVVKGPKIHQGQG
eukprot:2567626-Prymnesium_polylepis.1